MILIALLTVEFNFQTFASQNISKSNSTINTNDNVSQASAPTEILNAFISNSNKDNNKDIISIISINQNQRQIQVDSFILDRLISNITLGNTPSIPLGSFCTTLDGTSSGSLGINEQTPYTVTFSNNNKQFHIDFDYQVIENDDTNSIEEYCNGIQQPNNLILQRDEMLVFSKEGGEAYDDSDIYLVEKN